MIGLFCAVLLLLSLAAQQGRKGLREWRSLVLIVMLTLMAIGLFVLQPMMVDLKAQGPISTGSALAAQFGRLHGLASILYMLVSLCGLALVALGLRKPDNGFALFR